MCWKRMVYKNRMIFEWQYLKFQEQKKLFPDWQELPVRMKFKIVDFNQ